MRTRRFPGAVGALVALGAAAAAAAGGRDAAAAKSTVAFEDVTRAAGVQFRHGIAHFDPKARNVMPWITAGGAAVAVGDFDNDGLDDLYFTTSVEGGKNGLYHNDGNFHFTEVGARSGIADVNGDPAAGTSSFALWFDYDGDGWQDLLLVRFGKLSLYRNKHDGTFEDTTAKAGVGRFMNALSAVAFDYDRDGRLDLYVAGYFPPKDLHHLPDTRILFDSWESARNGGTKVLFHNNGDGTFTDVTEQAGVQDTGWTTAVGHGDIDNDGWQDLYLANDFGPDTVFRNLGNGKFENITRKAIGVDTKKGMCVEFGDYNNDGFLDVYVTNMTEPYLRECNMLWRNNRDLTFTDVSEEERACDTGWGWGAKFVDVDNDGWLDLYVANGFISAGKGEYMDVLLDFVFKEDVDNTDVALWPPIGDRSMAGGEPKALLRKTLQGYESIGEAAGVASKLDGRGVAIADFDGDGRMDLVLTNLNAPPIIYRNVSVNGNHWLELRLEDPTHPNHAAIGARVIIRAGGTQQLREVNAGNGFAAQSTNLVHFGLGARSQIDELAVRWPDGATEKFPPPPVDSAYRLVRGKGFVAPALAARKAKR
ncbi:MAG TPA: CRTAC1 family protein [Myxococcales bacterium]